MRPKKISNAHSGLSTASSDPTSASLDFSESNFAEALQQNKVALLEDRDLAQAVPQLFKHVLDAGFFENRFDGMTRIRDPKSELEVQLTPNRRIEGLDRKKAASSGCVLCHPHDHRSRRAQWRNYFLLPNKYPYVRPEKEHLLILPTAHKSQSFSGALLDDMVDYQEFAGAKTPLTLHYNGLAGNSQAHLHWQSTQERLPLQGALEANQLSLTHLRSSESGKIETFDQDVYSGFVLSGDKEYVTHWATEIVQHLDDELMTSLVDEEGQRRGTYNMLLLPQTDGKIKLVIQPRRANSLRVKVGMTGKIGVGAFTLGGVFVLIKDRLSPDFFDEVVRSVRPTLVSPSEFSWLNKLRR